MSNKAIAGDSPMSFKAGGKSASNAASSLKKRERHTEEKKDDLNLFDQIAQPPPSACHRTSLQPSPEIHPGPEMLCASPAITNEGLETTTG